MPNVRNYEGLAVVFARASEYPEFFVTWNDRECADVEELPPGTKVLVLPKEDADAGWAPVVVADDRDGARFTWHHPDCLKPFPAGSDLGVVTVGHTCSRGRDPPSHNVENLWCGAHCQPLVLDARWEEADQSARDTTYCSGWCASVCVETASLPNRVADILTFASAGRSGYALCNRGKHRSLSAAVILELFFGRRVDYQFASRWRPCDCKRPAHRNKGCIAAAFRSLPKRTRPANLLLFILKLRTLPNNAAFMGRGGWNP